MTAPAPTFAIAKRPAPFERWTWLATALGLAALFGALSHWVIFEYDLFWEVRAGREILSGQGVQSVDRWSHTAYGLPWHNFQWLSTVLMALAAKLAPDYAALSWLRSFLIAGWIFLIGRFARAGSRSWLIALALIPWVYLASWFRLQMRPDLFGLCAFAGLLSILRSRKSEKAKRLAGLGLLVVWANLHAGTVVFGILLFGVYALTSTLRWRDRILLSGAGFLTWFLTPGGVVILQIIRDNALVYDQAKTGNPDLQPFSMALLDFPRGGWAIRLWVLYCALAAYCLAKPAKGLIAPYQHRWFALFISGALTLEALHHIRAIPYQMVFLIPVVAAKLAELKPATQWLGLGATAAFLLVLVLPFQVRFVAKPLGTQVSALDVPVESAAFLRMNHPSGKLHNAYAFGGYLIDDLPDYPVSIDGRELPFAAFRDEMDRAVQSGTYADFLRAHGIGVVVETLPAPVLDAQRALHDPHEALYPRTEWATVFFDNVSIVYLRRTPMNAAIIAAHEYKSLRRGLPASWPATAPGLTGPARGDLATELQQCLKDVPDSVYCRIGMAAFWSNGGQAEIALKLLNEARQISPHNLELLIALLQLANARGDQAQVEELVNLLDHVGSRTPG
jgi:hypothetical protein